MVGFLMTEREMKSYEERLPLIDAAIENFNGDMPSFYNALHVKQDSITRYSGTCEHDYDYVCTRDEFNQRKAERQNKPSWDNAPEWAQWLGLYNGHEAWVGNEGFMWVREPYAYMQHYDRFGVPDKLDFSIIEKRPETKEQDMNDWYEKGELPPVGAVVEVAPLWDRVLIVAHNNGDCVFFNKASDKYDCFRSGDYFRPIRTETDKLVDEIASVMNEANPSWLAFSVTDAAKALVKAGYRKIKQQSEQEFMKQCVDICGHGDARLYRAGCRFIEKVKV